MMFEVELLPSETGYELIPSLRGVVGGGVGWGRGRVK